MRWRQPHVCRTPENRYLLCVCSRCHGHFLLHDATFSGVCELSEGNGVKTKKQQRQQQQNVRGSLNLVERDSRRWTFSVMIAGALVNDWQLLAGSTGFTVRLQLMLQPLRGCLCPDLSTRRRKFSVRFLRWPCSKRTLVLDFFVKWLQMNRCEF